LPGGSLAIVDDIVFVDAFVSPISAVVDVFFMEDLICLRWSGRGRCGSAARSAIV
jgi:hypothetical protein